MALQAGLLRESIVIEQQAETRNAFGEVVSTWSTFATRRAAVQSISYSEQQRRKQVGGSGTFTVRCRYVEGVTGKMRVRWASRSNRMLTITAVVEVNHLDEHELTCEEQVT